MRSRFKKLARPAFRSGLEQLESRSVMSGVTCGLSAGNLLVCGTEADDHLELVTTAEQMLEVRTADTVRGTFPLADVQSIDVQTYGGNDRVAVSSALTVPLSINGSAANYNLAAGPAVPLNLNSSSASHSEHSEQQHAELTTAKPPLVTAMSVPTTSIPKTAAATTSDPEVSRLLTNLFTAPALSAAIVSYAPQSASAVNSFSGSSSAVSVDHGSHTASGPSLQTSAAHDSAGGEHQHDGGDATNRSSGIPVVSQSLTNRTWLPGSAESGNRSTRSVVQAAKACELKTTLSKRAKASMYTSYECKCDEGKWSGRSAKRVLQFVIPRDEENSTEQKTTARCNSPERLVWSGRDDLCTTRPLAEVLSAFQAEQDGWRNRVEQAWEQMSAPAAISPVTKTNAEEVEAVLDWHGVGTTLVVAGIVMAGLSAIPRLPAVPPKKQQSSIEEPIDGIFLPFELLNLAY